jgi:hypothetical protein
MRSYRPYGTRALVETYRHFRAGLSHAAASRLDQWLLLSVGPFSRGRPQSCCWTKRLRPGAESPAFSGFLAG